MKNLLNIEGVQKLSKNEQQTISGGLAEERCPLGKTCQTVADCGPTINGSLTCPSIYKCLHLNGVGHCHDIWA